MSAVEFKRMKIVTSENEDFRVVTVAASGDDGRHDDAHDGEDSATDDSGGDSSPGTVVVTKPKTETRTPAFYRVILVNDDYTPMDFVIHVLQKFFNKDLPEATKIMLQVHHKGAGTCGVFSYEIAETKVYHVNQYSRQNKHPLKCTMEKA